MSFENIFQTGSPFPRPGFMLAKIKNLIADFLFPAYCLGCKRRGNYCCQNCANSLEKTNSIFANKNADNVSAIFAATNFEDKSLLSKLIHSFKYDFIEEIAEILVSLFSEKPPPIFGKDSILVPVPLHTKRLNFRGFNQSLVIARLLSKKWKIPFDEILVRQRHTKPQVGLGNTERLLNVRNAFALKKFCFPGPMTNYLIVDDVCTTGATINECAKILRKNGAKKIFGVVIARTDRV